MIPSGMKWTRAEWDEMQALMRASVGEAQPGEDIRETPSGKAVVSD